MGKPQQVHWKAGGYDYSENRDDTFAACAAGRDDEGGNWPMTSEKKDVTCARCKNMIKRALEMKAKRE